MDLLELGEQVLGNLLAFAHVLQAVNDKLGDFLLAGLRLLGIG